MAERKDSWDRNNFVHGFVAGVKGHLNIKQDEVSFLGIFFFFRGQTVITGPFLSIIGHMNGDCDGRMKN